MQMFNLIEKINIYGAKVIFDRMEDVARSIFTGNHIIYFTPVDKREEKIYEHCGNIDDFKSKTASIHIPDLSVQDFINIYECDGTGLYEYTKGIIAPFCNKGVPEDIVYITYLFLHEVGHWMQFIDMDRNVTQFINWDAEAEKQNAIKMKSLEEQRRERIQRGSKCILTAKEKKLFNQYMYEYREIPKEKNADDFAFKEIQSALDIYVKMIETES